MATEPVDYCREIEAYLCRKNDGHLVRVVGPSFEIVSGWAVRGVPLKIAFQGIDRYFERYYRKGSPSRGRRRPVKVDFCDADVFDVFDEWRRALGLTMAPFPPGTDRSTNAAGETSASSVAGARSRSAASLPAHLERVVLRLTAARASGRIDEAFDEVIDRAARELDLARASSAGVRGEARQALLDRLAALDGELLLAARAALDERSRGALAREADEELTAFRASMPADVFGRAHEAAIDRLVRQRFGLPSIIFA